jgi:hypothetical protein
MKSTAWDTGLPYIELSRYIYNGLMSNLYSDRFTSVRNFKEDEFFLDSVQQLPTSAVTMATAKNAAVLMGDSGYYGRLNGESFVVVSRQVSNQ